MPLWRREGDARPMTYAEQIARHYAPHFKRRGAGQPGWHRSLEMDLVIEAKRIEADLIAALGAEHADAIRKAIHNPTE